MATGFHHSFKSQLSETACFGPTHHQCLLQAEGMVQEIISSLISL